MKYKSVKGRDSVGWGRGVGEGWAASENETLFSTPFPRTKKQVARLSMHKLEDVCVCFSLAHRYMARTAALAPYSIAVIVEPIGTAPFGWSFSKTSKAGTRAVTPSTKRICHAIRATFVLFAEGICAAKTLYKKESNAFLSIARKHYPKKIKYDLTLKE